MMPDEVLSSCFIHLNNSADLVSCMLASRVLHEPARVILYNRITLSSTKHRDAVFLLLGNTDIHIFQSLKHLDFGFKVPSDDENIDEAVEEYEQELAVQNQQDNTMDNLSLKSQLDEGYHSRHASTTALDFLNPSTQPYETSWQNYFVASYLPLIPSSLCSLNLSLAQFDDISISALFKRMHRLDSLDLSYSSIRKAGLGSVPATVKHLNVSGIFRLRRIPVQTLVDLIFKCTLLKTLIAKDCMDLVGDVAFREWSMERGLTMIA